MLDFVLSVFKCWAPARCICLVLPLVYSVVYIFFNWSLSCSALVLRHSNDYHSTLIRYLHSKLSTFFLLPAPSLVSNFSFEPNGGLARFTRAASSVPSLICVVGIPSYHIRLIIGSRVARRTRVTSRTRMNAGEKGAL